MALKADCRLREFRQDCFMDEVATRGGVVVYSTAGSGAALDQASNLVTYAANSSGKAPVGFLLSDMVDVDLTRYKVNQHKDEVQKGGKVNVVHEGWVLTNFYVGAPTGGAKAYLSSSGYLTPTQSTELTNPTVGRFEGSPDEDGYVKVYINLP